MKKKIIKILSAALSLIMVISMAACGQTEQKSSESKKESSAKEESKVESSSKEEAPKAKDPVPVEWVLMLTGVEVDNSNALKKASEIAKEKLNINLTFNQITVSDYGTKIQAMAAASEEFDLMYTSNWLNDFQTNVSKGALLPLDDLLKETPDLYNSVPEWWWEAIKVDGKIYGVPNQQIATRSTCFAIPTKNIELLGLDMTGATDIVTDYHEVLDKIEDYLIKVKEATGEYTKLPGLWNEGLNMFGFDQVVSATNPAVIRMSDEKATIINGYETEEFKEYIKKRREWVEKGLVQPQVEDDRTLGELKDNKEKVYPEMGKYSSYQPGIEATISGDVQRSIYIVTPMVLTNSAVTSTLTGISSTSKNPLEALKVIELVNTDKEFHNLLAFGTEGENYKKVGENRVEKITEWNVYDWSIGSVYNSYLFGTQLDDQWEQTKAINDSAIKSKVLGFSPSQDKIKPQIAACQAVIDEYFQVLEMGVVDVDSTYEAFIEQLDAAGVDEIIKELQSQLDAWLANE